MTGINRSSPRKPGYQPPHARRSKLPHARFIQSTASSTSRLIASPASTISKNVQKVPYRNTPTQPRMEPGAPQAPVRELLLRLGAVLLISLIVAKWRCRVLRRYRMRLAQLKRDIQAAQVIQRSIRRALCRFRRRRHVLHTVAIIITYRIRFRAIMRRRKLLRLLLPFVCQLVILASAAKNRIRLRREKQSESLSRVVKFLVARRDYKRRVLLRSEREVFLMDATAVLTTLFRSERTEWMSLMSCATGCFGRRAAASQSASLLGGDLVRSMLSPRKWYAALDFAPVEELALAAPGIMAMAMSQMHTSILLPSAVDLQSMMLTPVTVIKLRDGVLLERARLLEREESLERSRLFLAISHSMDLLHHHCNWSMCCLAAQHSAVGRPFAAILPHLYPLPALREGIALLQEEHAARKAIADQAMHEPLLLLNHALMLTSRARAMRRTQLIMQASGAVVRHGAPPPNLTSSWSAGTRSWHTRRVSQPSMLSRTTLSIPIWTSEDDGESADLFLRHMLNIGEDVIRSEIDHVRAIDLQPRHGGFEPSLRYEQLFEHIHIPKPPLALQTGRHSHHATLRELEGLLPDIVTPDSPLGDNEREAIAAVAWRRWQGGSITERQRRPPIHFVEYSARLPPLPCAPPRRPRAMKTNGSILPQVLHEANRSVV